MGKIVIIIIGIAVLVILALILFGYIIDKLTERIKDDVYYQDYIDDIYYQNYIKKLKEEEMDNIGHKDDFDPVINKFKDDSRDLEEIIKEESKKKL